MLPRHPRPSCLLYGLLIEFSVLRTSSTTEGQAVTQWPFHDDRPHKVIQWDHYNFQTNVFISSSEGHYQRIPVPDL